MSLLERLSLVGRHALVCGASRGIGRASAIALAELGADVTLLARDRDALAALAGTLPRPHPAQRHGFVAADVAQPEVLVAQVSAAGHERAFAICVNNTAGPPGGPVQAAQPEQFLQTFHRHLLAAHALAQALLPGMRGQRYGRIVNVISTSVKEPIRNLGVSNTIRGAVAAWAKTLASEVAADGITVNNVLPGYTRTDRLAEIVGERARSTGKSAAEIEAAMLATVPAARFADASEIAGAIAFLCTPAAAYVNGVNLPVDGGRTQSL